MQTLKGNVGCGWHRGGRVCFPQDLFFNGIGVKNTLPLGADEAAIFALNKKGEFCIGQC